MVIGHNHGQPGIRRGGNLLSRRNAVVTGHNRINAVRDRALHQAQIQPIAVRNAVRNIIVRSGAERPQPPHQDVGRADAVNVIVADDANRRSAPYLLRQNADALRHIRQQRAARYVIQGAGQIFADFFFRDAPVNQNPRQHR